MHSRCIAHRSGRGLDKSRIQAYRWRRVYRRATGGCDGSTAGNWASSDPAFTVSRRRCGTKPYTSSGRSRFPAMLLSLPPFGLRSGGRLEVICPELRPSRMAIHSMRRMAHPFTAPGSPGIGNPATAVIGSLSSQQPTPRIPKVICDYFVPRVSIPCRPSPCPRLSRAPSTMAAPTLAYFIDGLLISICEPPTFTMIRSARWCRQRLHTTNPALRGIPNGYGVHQVAHIILWAGNEV
jgi:hypothetical protein